MRIIIIAGVRVRARPSVSIIIYRAPVSVVFYETISNNNINTEPYRGRETRTLPTRNRRQPEHNLLCPVSVERRGRRKTFSGNNRV